MIISPINNTQTQLDKRSFGSANKEVQEVISQISVGMHNANMPNPLTKGSAEDLLKFYKDFHQQLVSQKNSLLKNAKAMTTFTLSLYDMAIKSAEERNPVAKDFCIFIKDLLIKFKQEKVINLPKKYFENLDFVINLPLK